jgi:hypothetical protein
MEKMHATPQIALRNQRRLGACAIQGSLLTVHCSLLIKASANWPLTIHPNDKKQALRDRLQV